MIIVFDEESLVSLAELGVDMDVDMDVEVNRSVATGPMFAAYCDSKLGITPSVAGLDLS